MMANLVLTLHYLTICLRNYYMNYCLEQGIGGYTCSNPLFPYYLLRYVRYVWPALLIRP